MPTYEYECVAGHRTEKFLWMREYVDTIVCVCGSKAKARICAPAFNTNVTRWDLKDRPGHSDQMENERCVVTFLDDCVNKDGLPVSEIPETPISEPMPSDPGDRRDWEKMVWDKTPSVEDTAPTPGTCHPLEFKPDNRLRKKIRLDSLKGTT